MIDKEGKTVLFCYRDCKHIRPYYKKAKSEYYKDIDGDQVVALLPHCPTCNQEVYSEEFHGYVQDFQKYLQQKGSFSHEV